MASIELRARHVVEGLQHGMHRSPFLGSTVEFSSHREYVPGDDLRHVNWKLFARQKRLYVKEFDAENNLQLTILLDVSNSMGCANGELSKIEFSAILAMVFAHLCVQQHDAVGLITFSDDVHGNLPPRAQPQQLETLKQAMTLTKLKQCENAAGGFQHAAEQTGQRRFVMIFSDMFGDMDGLLQGLDQLNYRRHEVVLFHVWDPVERHLPLDGLYRFDDLETGEQIDVRAEGIRDAYLKRVQTWCDDLERECRHRAIERYELTTEDSVEQVVWDFLEQRAAYVA